MRFAYFLFSFFVVNQLIFASDDPRVIALLKGVEAERMKYEPIQVNFTTEYVKGNDFETIIISRFTKLSN